MRILKHHTCDSKNVTLKLSAAAGFNFSTRCEGQMQGFGPTLPKKRALKGSEAGIGLVRGMLWCTQATEEISPKGFLCHELIEYNLCCSLTHQFLFQVCAKAVMRMSWMRMKANPPTTPT